MDHIVCGVRKKKLDHSEYDTFREFYTKNWQKFVDYNIVDVELVDKLEDKLKLIDLCCTRCYDAKINFMIAFQGFAHGMRLSTIILKKKNVVIPQKDRNKKDEKYLWCICERS